SRDHPHEAELVERVLVDEHVPLHRLVELSLVGEELLEAAEGVAAGVGLDEVRLAELTRRKLREIDRRRRLCGGRGGARGRGLRGGGRRHRLVTTGARSEGEGDDEPGEKSRAAHCRAPWRPLVAGFALSARNAVARHSTCTSTAS